MTTTRPRSFTYTAAIATLSLAGLFGSSTAAAEEIYTGCKGPGGNLTNVAIGDEPLRRCPNKFTQITWSETGTDGTDGKDGINCWDLNEDGVDDPNEDINRDGAWDVKDCAGSLAPSVSQAPEVELNHQHICEALANLGQYPLGCPSVDHVVPSGVLTEMKRVTFVDNGNDIHTSCGSPPDDGLLRIEKQGEIYYWVVEGGFVASKSRIAFQDELPPLGTDETGACQNKCSFDSNCVASMAELDENKDGNNYTCYTFHHSDTITQNWRLLCGNRETDCLASLAIARRWSTMCPTP